MKTTAAKCGLSYDKLEVVVINSIIGEGGAATTKEIVGAVERRMAPHTLSPVGQAGVRCFVNREMVHRGFVTPAYDGDGNIAWAVTQAGRQRVAPRRIVVIKKKPPQAAPPVVIRQTREASPRERLALTASKYARAQFHKGNDGAVIRKLSRFEDADDIAQDAAVRALVAARNYDPARGAVSTYANQVSLSTIRDRRRNLVARSRRIEFVDGPQYEVFAEGRVADDVSVSERDFHVAVPFRCPSQDLAGHEEASRVLNSVRNPSARRALERWVFDGADGSQVQLPGELRLKDALCVARKQARTTMAEAVT